MYQIFGDFNRSNIVADEIFSSWSLKNMYLGDFHQNGLIRLPNLITSGSCENICQKIQTVPAEKIKSLDKFAGDYQVSGERLSHLIIDGITVFEMIPELEVLYHSLAFLVSQIAQKQIVYGKYPKSDLNVLIYEKGSVKSAHYDTVPISLVVFLTTHQAPSFEGAFYYKDLNGNQHVIQPRAGDAVIFQGQKIFHWVNELSEQNQRIIVNANYYTSDDFRRAEGIDDLLFS